MAVSVREARDAGQDPTASVDNDDEDSREGEHAGVEPDLTETRDHGRSDVEECRENQSHQGGADHTAAEREQQAFAEHNARTEVT